MMKARTSFLKRCLALALALLMLVSSTNMGIVMQAFAAGDKISVSYGKIVAENYELSDAEKALLSSGYLAGGTYEHDALGENLVTVDTENKKITAANSGSWKPASASIIAGGEDVETIAISNGECTYTYEGNAFSVKVKYTLKTKKVSTDLQTTMLNTGSWLKAGIANVDKLVAQSGLETLELAMPQLVDMCERGYQVGSMTATVADDTKAAIHRLNDQMTANGGNLDLVVMQNSYNSCKTQYLLNNGLDMKAKLEATKADAALIHTLLGTIKQFSGYFDVGEALKLVEMLHAILGNWITTADAVIAGDWTAATKGTALVSASVNYAELDNLVAALGSKTEVTVKDTLLVAEDYFTVNMAMNDVTVEVVLNTTQDNKVQKYDAVTGKVTLAENSTAEEIAAAAQATVKAALEGWEGVYVADHFEASYSKLPDALTEDITYTITYAPKNYTITKWDGSTEKVPYGYQFTLPVNDDTTKAYDYYIAGKYYAQGAVITIEGDVTITRDSGKAYIDYQLYTVIADNYGDDIAKKILKSGALNGDEIIYVREIDNDLIKLENGTLTAEATYPSDYKGKNWVPYSYGASGTENLFNGASAAWADPTVKALYRLTLDNFSVAKVTEILSTVAAIKAEAAAQKSTLDAFAENYDTMGQLDKTKLGALNGVIGVTDFTPDDGTDTDEKNLELRAYFSETVGNIIANNLDADGKLKIYNMMGQYKSEGLKYYYNNSNAFIAEIDTLSGYLDKLLAEEEALKIMVTAAGFPEYADKITDLGGKMNTVKNSLTAPNAMIDLTSDKLGNLIEILEKDGDATYSTPGHPYLTSPILSAEDPNAGIAKVILKVTGIEATPYWPDTRDKLEKGDTVTATIISDLKAAVEAKMAEVYGDNAKHYKVDFAKLDELEGTELTGSVTVELTCVVKNYTVTLWDGSTATININDRTITLPAHTENGWAYDYITPEGEKTAYNQTGAVSYVVKTEHLGNFTITRTAKDVASENFKDVFPDNGVTDKDGNKKVYANATGSDMMGWAMALANSGYNPIKLNGREFVYLTEENTTEICLQAFIDAMLEDENFSSETLINLGKTGSGTLFTADLELGTEDNPNYIKEADFVFNFKSVPSEMGTVANGLESIKDYMTFNADGKGTMELNVTLPAPVYEAYVTVLLGGGQLDKADINTADFTDEIAAMFLYDYIDLILNTDANTTTYTNTLKKLGIDKDLTGAESYYQLVKKALTGKHDKLDIAINAVEDDGIIDVSVAANGNASIGKLLSLVGLDGDTLSTYTAMIKEYKSGDLTVNAVADLKNTPHSYDALVLDIDADGITNKFDYTTNLASKTTAGKAVVILLDDVNDNVNFGGTTILDLNGYTITGNVTAGGDLYIVDSSMETESGAGIIGNVSASSVVALGGMVNVTPGDGYVKNDAGYIHSELFTVSGGEGNYTYNVNTDIIGSDTIGSYTAFAKLLAVDVAVDVALNYYTASALSADGNTIYALNLDQLITLITSGDKVEAIVNKVLGCFDAPALAAFTNDVLEDVLDFGAVAEALNNGTAVASYELTTNPWMVAVTHVEDGNYIDFGLAPNADLPKTLNIGIAFVGDNKQPVADLCEELGKIAGVTVTVGLEQPTFADKQLTVKGSVNETAEIDMSGNTDYAKMIGVILAYGNSAKRADVAAAVNADDMDALKTVIDNTSVAELFTALKKMSRTVNFAAMAETVGVTEGVDSIAELEADYHIFLCAAGKVLEKADITGMDSKFGGLYNETTGQYELLKSKLFNKDEAIRSYSVFAELDVQSIGATVKLFPEETTDPSDPSDPSEPELDCLWGDVNHDDKVNTYDATLIVAQYLGNYNDDIKCLLRADVNDDGQINTYDATLVVAYYLGNIDTLPYLDEVTE